jgi:wyosine [tRNA(Phe)-imidazoG37] synthetase (radical SAM superfamily)
LNKAPGKIIRVSRKITSIPVALLIYCPSLLRKNIRKALLAADIVLPSLDAAISEILAKFTHAHPPDVWCALVLMLEP